MAFHLLSARRLSERLGSGDVSAQEQAFYLSASFVLWLLPAYLLIIPPPDAAAWLMPLGLWFFEAFVLAMIYVFGVRYCLARCHIEPRQNFLIDFSCLFAPISLTTLVVVWGLFHVYASLVPWTLFHVYASLLPWWFPEQTFDRVPRFVEFIYSARFFDLMRFFAVVGANFFVFVRVGNYVERVSKLRRQITAR